MNVTKDWLRHDSLTVYFAYKIGVADYGAAVYYTRAHNLSRPYQHRFRIGKACSHPFADGRALPLRTSQTIISM